MATVRHFLLDRFRNLLRGGDLRLGRMFQMRPNPHPQPRTLRLLQSGESGGTSVRAAVQEPAHRFTCAVALPCHGRCGGSAGSSIHLRCGVALPRVLRWISRIVDSPALCRQAWHGRCGESIRPQLTTARYGFKSALLLVLCVISAGWQSMVHADTIVIGQVAPLSGTNAVDGVLLSRGAKLYFDHINATGGVNGHRIQFIVRDDQGRVEETVRHATELVNQQKIMAMLSTVGTDNTEELIRQKILENAGVPLVWPHTGLTSLADAANVFPVRANYQDEAEKIVRQLVTVGLTRVGVVYQDDSFGKDGVTGIDNALQNHLLRSESIAAFNPVTLDVNNAVKTMLEKTPQAIVVLGTTRVAGQFIKEFHAKGGISQIFCFSVVDPILVAQYAGKEAIRGVAMTVVVPSPRAVSTPVIREMINVRNSLGMKDLEITFNSVEGFIAAKVMVEGIRRAGARPSRESLSNALKAINTLNVGGYTVYVTRKPAQEPYVDLAIFGPSGALMK